jgi:hypothetical protein
MTRILRLGHQVSHHLVLGHGLGCCGGGDYLLACNAMRDILEEYIASMFLA